MKVTIEGGYEAAKEQIYNEALINKQNELKNIYFKIFDKEFVMGLIVIAFLFAVSFDPSFNPKIATIILRYGMLVVIVFELILRIRECKSSKKLYADLIEKQKSMTFDEYVKYVECIEKDDIYIDSDIIYELDRLKRLELLSNPDIISMEYTVNDLFWDICLSFLIETKNNQKETIDIVCGCIEYTDSEEELVWEVGLPILFRTNNKELVNKC